MSESNQNNFEKAEQIPIPAGYRLKITLLDTDPPVWRRVEVPSHISLNMLHLVIQDAIGWQHECLYHFLVESVPFGRPDWERTPLRPPEDARLVYLFFFAQNEGQKLEYEYDFAGGWKHEIEVEGIIKESKTLIGIRCLEGERACPPEGIGGPRKYTDMLEALSDPSHRDHAIWKENTGDDFDPDRFDLDRVNRLLTRLG